MLLSLEEEYDYMCFACGRTDLEDIDDDTEGNRTNGGVVYPSVISEVFICSFCRFFIEE
jgi:hypothetical protein